MRPLNKGEMEMEPCCSSSSEEEEEKMGGHQRISVSDHIADSFVIDMDAFSSAPTTIPNSRITLQRSLSRKGSQRGGDRKVNGNATLHDKDTVPATPSPKGPPCTPEKGGLVVVGSTTTTDQQHQFSMTTGATESSKSMSRRNSFRRSSSWALDPKRVLLFFATLSSMGTMLLIYFTLTMSKQDAQVDDQYIHTHTH